MLPARFRLTAKEFPSLFRFGSRTADGAIFLLSKPNQLEQSRFGFIASAKIFPLATDRHRAKRMVREALRSQLSHIRPGYDIVVVYRFRPLQWYPDILHSVEQILKRQHLIH